MMRIKLSILTFFILLASNILGSQTNNLTGSPYSLFGLGVETNSNVGKNSGMGNVGIAVNDQLNINLLNPASFSEIGKNNFLFDFGFFTELEILNEDDINELRLSSSFSNAAIAFPLSEESAMGISLRPFTSVGYSIIGLQTNIEGSMEQFSSSIFGTGGLNDFRLDYGKSFNNNLNIGIRASYLFGNINENEIVETETSSILINESFRYSGILIALGAQYKINKEHSLGILVDIESKLRNRKDSSVSRGSNQASLEVVESNNNEKADSFTLPFKLGLGYSYTIKNLVFALDFTRKFWNRTNQNHQSGTFVDQNLISLGGEIIPDVNSLKYWKTINYRAGLFYDSGYINIDNDTVENFGLSIGIGLPISASRRSFVNVSFQSGIRGSNKNILVQDNFNTLNINLSFSDIWFQKRKIN